MIKCHLKINKDKEILFLIIISLLLVKLKERINQIDTCKIKWIRLNWDRKNRMKIIRK
jgi:hypothetical protein